jgi:hypothetical protein
MCQVTQQQINNKKWLLDLALDDDVRWKSQDLEMFLQFAKHMKVQGS